MIVDTHVHVIAPDQYKYPRTPSAARTEWVRDLSGETLIEMMGEAGIDRTVLVQAYGAYAYDNSYAADCAAHYPGRFASVCILNPLQPGAPDELSHLVTRRGVRGLRLFTRLDPPITRLDDPRTFPLWERAESLQIPLCAMIGFSGVPHLREPLERFPKVPLALDHLGLPRLNDGPPYDMMRPLLELARFPNLYLKFSSVSMYAARRGQSTPREFFSRLLDAFGAKRMMWGSNFPATHDRTLKEQLGLAQEELAFVPAEDRRWLFGETALSLWPALR